MCVYKRNGSAEQVCPVPLYAWVSSDTCSSGRSRGKQTSPSFNSSWHFGRHTHHQRRTERVCTHVWLRRDTDTAQKKPNSVRGGIYDWEGWEAERNIHTYTQVTFSPHPEPAGCLRRAPRMAPRTAAPSRLRPRCPSECVSECDLVTDFEEVLVTGAHVEAKVGQSLAAQVYITDLAHGLQFRRVWHGWDCLNGS